MYQKQEWVEKIDWRSAVPTALNGCRDKWNNLRVSGAQSTADPLLKLADNLGELEVVIGDRARPVVAEVRAALMQALARRAQGDLAGALELIKNAMERLAGLGSQLDPGEGAMMRAIAERFASALGSGHKDTAKEAAGVMRRKAGDTKKEDRTDW